MLAFAIGSTLKAMSTPGVTCVTCVALVQEWNDCVRTFGEAVGRMKEEVRSDNATFEIVARNVEVSRLAAEQAKMKLEAHRAEHTF